MTSRPLFVLWAVSLAALASAPPSVAGPKKRGGEEEKKEAALRLRLIDPSLESLPFGGGVDDVLAWARVRLEERYGPRLKSALDARERAVVQQQMEDELATLKAGVVVFDGRRTGYEVSIVQGEFLPGAGESLLLFREGEQEHYFFFSHEKLWKYGRPFKATDDFALRLANFTTDQGEPTEVLRAGDPVLGPVKEATWRDAKTQLRIRDRRLMFRSDIVFVEDVAALARVEESRGGDKAAAAGEKDVDPDLDDFLEGGGK